MTTPAKRYRSADYRSTVKPVWCAGCGHYGVLGALYKAMAELQVEPWNTVILSGIGCSSRLPGYVKTYGFNGVHGRALTLATGVKVGRPDLTVIAVGGDGDGLAIGGNHLIHTARRNLEITYILMNNSIYGLTKGQAAPTTPAGDRTKSSYWGNPEPSVDPCEMAISAGATWVGRGFSAETKTLVHLMVEALKHPGFSLLEVVSPCVTWRGADQFERLKAKLRPVPEEHDPATRAMALKYTREVSHLTTGVLYQVQELTLMDRLNHVRQAAKGDRPEPTTAEIVKTFYPTF